MQALHILEAAAALDHRDRKHFNEFKTATGKAPNMDCEIALSFTDIWGPASNSSLIWSFCRTFVKLEDLLSCVFSSTVNLTHSSNTVQHFIPPSRILAAWANLTETQEPCHLKEL